MRQKGRGLFIGLGCLISLLLTNLWPVTVGRVQAVATHLVINEIAIDSKVGTGGAEDDWVELFNPTAQSVALTGWSIQKSTASGGSVVRQSLTGSVPANGYFLIVRDNASTTQALKDKADLLVADTFSLASNNVVYLVNGNVNITGATDPSIVDLVGFGTSAIFEGAGPAPSIAEAKSIVRSPEGQDSNQNSLDFVVNDTPSPQNSASRSATGLDGSVLLTVTPEASPVQNITANSAEINFQVNASGQANVNFGLTGSYGSSTSLTSVTANVTKSISLSGLSCGQTYHYSIYAENSGALQTDESDDATFTTLPCGITLDNLVMTKQTAKANNNYSEGWAWEFNITVWNMAETHLRMKFNRWSGVGNLEAGGNMQYSIDSGLTWANIDTSGAYSNSGLSLSGVDNSLSTGRQVKILVRMKVPVGSLAGQYNSSFGILTE
jgi:predicted extracellular nuclease